MSYTQQFVNVILSFNNHPSTILDDFLTLSIASFARGTMEEQYFEVMRRYPKDFDKFVQLLVITANALENQEDVLGDAYMELASKSKSQALGQFFTPMHLTNLMAKITAPDFKQFIGKSISDPACGSGRTLLAFAFNLNDLQKIQTRFFGVDLDSICLKMCVVNCFLNGIIGTFICGDSLRLKAFFGYNIQLCSKGLPIVVKIPENELDKQFGDYQKAKNEQLTQLTLQL